MRVARRCAPATDPSTALYGTARVERVLATANSARGAVAALRDDVRTFVGGAAQSDDMTVLAVRWQGP